MELIAICPRVVGLLKTADLILGYTVPNNAPPFKLVNAIGNYY
jgi:hypothetical protein